MKAFLFLLMIASAVCSRAQNTILTPGINCFLINKSKYPLNSAILNIRTDTSLVEIDYTFNSTTGGVIIPAKKRSLYMDGRTSAPFISNTAMKSFFDSFMVKK